MESVFTRPLRHKGSEPALGREPIVRAAIELLDAEGAAGLSMRRLGTKLGSGATSLYWYVATKEDLFELAVDEVYGEVYVPEFADTGWRYGASVFANGMRAMLIRHPWVIGQLGLRPSLGPNALKMGDRLTALLLGGGFTGLPLSHAGSMLISHAIGSATSVAAVRAMVVRSGESLAEITAGFKPYLDQVSADHPHFTAFREQVGAEALDPLKVWDVSFEFGLERIFDGLESWLRDQRPSP